MRGALNTELTGQSWPFFTEEILNVAESNFRFACESGHDVKPWLLWHCAVGASESKMAMSAFGRKLPVDRLIGLALKEQ